MTAPVFVGSIDLEQHLTPARLWTHLRPEERSRAALAFYVQAKDDRASRQTADLAIARALRFREASVKKLAPEKKAGYLARLVPADDVLAAALLHALHLEHRRPLLGAFLDAFGIEHEDGVVKAESSAPPPEPAKVASAAEALFGDFPEAEVLVYLASLLAIEPDTWSGVKPVIAKRLAG